MRSIIIIGFGNIGQGILPLLKVYYPEHHLCILEPDLDKVRQDIAQEYGASLINHRVTEDNYVQILTPLLGSGDFVINLATSVSTHDLIQFCQTIGAFYLDTCIDPWTYSKIHQGIETTNYDLRERVRNLRSTGRSTALVAHGANPGFVSILLKKGLIEMAQKYDVACDAVLNSKDFAHLAQALDVRVIQISERDTQVSLSPRQGREFVSTWSVEGLVNECLQNAELGWGTHETSFPKNARRHPYGCKASIVLDQPSHTVKVKSWSPNFLDFEAYLITHNEAISLAQYLTVGEDTDPIYRPTVYYAYHPCDDAMNSMALLEDKIISSRILKDDIISGIDELGVFIISGTYPSLWLGSNLSIGKTRKMAPHNNATSLQVTSSIIGAMAWMENNPLCGVIESEDLDYEYIFKKTESYWAPIVRQFVQWKPCSGKTQFEFEDFRIDSLCEKVAA